MWQPYTEVPVYPSKSCKISHITSKICWSSPTQMSILSCQVLNNNKQKRKRAMQFLRFLSNKSTDYSTCECECSIDLAIHTVGHWSCTPNTSCANYSKTCLKRPLKKKTKLVFKTDFRLMQVKSIAECSPWSILQYLWTSLSYHLPIRFLLCLFLSGHFRQVILYIENLSIKLSVKL